MHKITSLDFFFFKIHKQNKTLRVLENIRDCNHRQCNHKLLCLPPWDVCVCVSVPVCPSVQGRGQEMALLGPRARVLYILIGIAE